MVFFNDLSLHFVTTMIYYKHNNTCTQHAGIFVMFVYNYYVLCVWGYVQGGCVYMLRGVWEGVLGGVRVGSCVSHKPV